MKIEYHVQSFGEVKGQGICGKMEQKLLGQESVDII